MDPAEILPTHIFENILSYFNTKEIKNMVSVNKLWYQVITSSCIWDKNIVFAVRNDWICDEEDVNYLIQCGKKRNFHSILLSDCTDMYDLVLDVITTKKRCYITNVSIFDMKFESIEKFEIFMKSFETTIKKLVFHRVEIKNVNDSKIIEFNMENLQNLKISHCSPKIYLSFLQKAPKLTSLTCDFGIEFNNELRKILKNASNLKKLSINTQLLCALVDETFTETKFQLKELNVNFSEFKISSEILQYIENFLESQLDLEKIYLSDWLSFSILNFVLSMKKLKELSLSSLPLFTWEFVNFTCNNSIEIFDIKTFQYDDFCDDVRKLLAAVPNVKHLKLRSLNNEIADFIAQNLKEIKSISLIHPTCKRENLSHVIFD
ncbi:hypothetical protein PVAND_007232 [Polypedilum vanderplanki]|uniref:F-box domain-containing protein n=1 Tax=Polypedilum vanderplanki TaxID=319348 RepID=A0A9J6C617_POLVA|nr:hypothetical protein PVAND_007232 [Polypedilum vanderplanki]